MSGGEIILIVVAILLLFGADKIPEFARTWGKGMREFRKATEDIRRELEASAPLNDLKKDFTEMQRTVLDESDSESHPVIRSAEEVEKSDMESYDKFYKGEEVTDMSARKPHAAWKESKEPKEPANPQQSDHDSV